METAHNQEGGWRRWTAILCLVVFLSISAGHAAHMCPLQLVGQSRAAVSAEGSPLCLACIAMHSSATEPLFHIFSPQGVVRSSAPFVFDRPPVPARFFRIFVRPPPSV